MRADISQLQIQPSQKTNQLSKRSPKQSQIVSSLAICIATSGLLGIAQAAAFSREANPQMEAEAALHLVCVKEKQHFICQPEKTGQNKETADVTKVTATVAPELISSTQQESISNILLGLTYLLPVGLGLGNVMYSRYSKYRSNVLKQQVEVLERLWDQNHQH